MGIKRGNTLHCMEVIPEQFHIGNVGAAFRFSDIVKKKLPEPVVRISFLNKREGIQRLLGSIMVITVYADEDAPRLVGIEEWMFLLAFLVHFLIVWDEYCFSFSLPVFCSTLFQWSFSL